MTPDPRKGRAGRKSKWHTHVLPNLDRIRFWRRMGFMEKDIYVKLDVAERSFYEYKALYPQLVQALKETKVDADREVVEALFKRACGFEYEEVEIIGTPDTTGKGIAKIEKVIKHKRFEPPNPTAIIFYLKNRCRDLWRDVQDHQHDHQGRIDHNIIHHAPPELLEEFQKVLALEIAKQRRLSPSVIDVSHEELKHHAPNNGNGNGNGSRNLVTTAMETE
jgi:hypothetical protein